MRDASHPRRGFGILAACAAAVILYGCLYPFHFHQGTGIPDAARILLSTYRERPSRSDFVANTLLYIPLGFCLFKALDWRWRALQVLFVTLAGMALATTVELAQSYDAGRVSAMSDIYSNTLGAFFGALAATLIHGEFGTAFPAGRDRYRLMPLILICCWLGYRLYPYLPAADIYKYWLAVKPLVRDPEISWFGLYRHTVIALSLALLLEDLGGLAASRVTFLAFIPALLFARILIVNVVLSPGEVVGGALALVVWYGLLARVPSRALWLAVLFVGVVAIDALAPFQFSPLPHPFGWIPFRGFLQGALAANVLSFLDKCFTYGTLLWLMRGAGLRLRIAALAGGAFVFGLHWLQMWIPGRSAEVTDLILLLSMAGIMRVVDQRAPRVPVRA